MIDVLGRALADRYRIERELGAGGMATVYLARDLRHDRDVAVKVLNPDLTESLGRERFVREIRTAARLTHPNILPLYESGEAGGFLFFVMPVMTGETLRDLLTAQRELPLEQVIRLATDVADALDYAHRHDVVHRDIKPENILLHEGHAIIADFGIGKAMVAAAAEVGGSADSMLTQVGVVVGTPAYMSPEQAAGYDVDGRSDLFALGCLLYEMLTGESPFTAPTVQATIAKRFLHTPPPVTTVRANVPTALSQVVMQLLEKEREDRLSSGARVVEALRSGAQALGVSTEAPVRISEASVAVIPFTNMSADPDNEYFSDGITDDIIVALTQVKGLKVAARTSSFSYKGKSTELATIGQVLGVRSVLQGSVRRAGNRVRVTAQLMGAADGYQLWSARYDRDLSDIFAIQDEIACAIVAESQQSLGLVHKTTQLVVRPTDDLEAYQLFLRGREAANRRSPDGFRAALDLFQQALARDPHYAHVYAALGDVYTAMGAYVILPKAEAAQQAEQALREAMRLAPSLAVVHARWAQLKLQLCDDWYEAGAYLERALQLDPHDAIAHTYSAVLHSMLGNLEQSRASAARAVAADPLSAFVRGVSVLCFPEEGIPGCDAAARLAHADAGLALDPESYVCLWVGAVGLSTLGRHDEALERIARAVAIAGRTSYILAVQARLLHQAGRRAEALAIRDELRTRAASEFVSEAAFLWMMGLDLGDEEALARGLQTAATESSSMQQQAFVPAAVIRAAAAHPRLGPLVRQLPFVAKWPSHLTASPPWGIAL